MNGENLPNVSSETRRCHCNKEDCRPGQRNGPECHRRAQLSFRARIALKLKELHRLKLEKISHGHNATP